MATREILSLDESTPQILAPQTGDTYLAPRTITITPETNTSGLVINGGTITADSPVLDLTQTWNNAAVTFTGLKFNVPTDSSASNSRLMDLQVGGTSQFRVEKDGDVISNGDVLPKRLIFPYTSPSGAPAGWNQITETQQRNTAFGFYDGYPAIRTSVSPNFTLVGYSNATKVVGNIPFAFGTNASGTSTQWDSTFGREDVGVLSQRHTSTAQTFRIYNTADGSPGSNYERGKIAWISNKLIIGTEKGGTGTARILEFQTDGNTRLAIGGLGGFTVSDGNGFGFGTVNGTKIGTGTTQKLAFWNATPVVQPVNSTAIDTLLVDTGLRASGGTANFATAIETSSTIKTGAPTGGTAAAWKLGAVASVTPTSPDRTIEVDIGGTIYYLHAKTTND